MKTTTALIMFISKGKVDFFPFSEPFCSSGLKGKVEPTSRNVSYALIQGNDWLPWLESTCLRHQFLSFSRIIHHENILF